MMIQWAAVAHARPESRTQDVTDPRTHAPDMMYAARVQ
jgi:hypothetical protein